MKTATVVTHSGAFHSDELMALVLLERYYFKRPMRLVSADNPASAAAILKGAAVEWPPFFFPDGTQDCRTPVSILRTRDPAALALAKADHETFVLDVGGDYEAEAKNLDHHQQSMNLTWPDATPLSSTGLAWKWLDERGFLSEIPDRVRQALEKKLIIPLDSHDNGVQQLPLAETCELYNRQIDRATAEQFELARAFLSQAFDNHLNHYTCEHVARSALEQAWAQRPAGQRHLVLDERLPYSDCSSLLYDISGGEAWLIGLPGKDGRFNVVSLPDGSGRFSIACPLPEEWRGRMDFQAELPTGEKLDIAFVHKTGFMGVVKGGKQEAEKFAAYAASRRPNPTPTRTPGR